MSEISAPARFLLDACLDAVNNPAFVAREGKTFCNMFTASIASRLGFTELVGLCANDQILLMRGHEAWVPVEVDKAAMHAKAGRLVVACQSDRPHGHVCVVIPADPVPSGKWGLVPQVANAGGAHDWAPTGVWIGRGLSWAFKELPELFCRMKEKPREA